MKKTNSGKTNLPNIRWMLVGYDLIVYVVAAVILLGIYRGMDKLTPVGMFQQISISLICIFGARFVGKIYGQVCGDTEGFSAISDCYSLMRLLF